MKIQKINSNTQKLNPSFKSVRVSADDADTLIKIFKSRIKDTEKADASLILWESNIVDIACKSGWVDSDTKNFITKISGDKLLILAPSELKKLFAQKMKALGEIKGKNNLNQNPKRYLQEFNENLNKLGASSFLKNKAQSARDMSTAELLKLLTKVEKQPKDVAENEKLINEALGS